METNETVILAAVQQHGYALEHASRYMKNNETVVLAAVQQDGDALRYAGPDLRGTISARASADDRCVQEYARGVLDPFVVHVTSIAELQADKVQVTCCTSGGGQMAVTLDRRSENSIAALRSKVAHSCRRRKAAASIVMLSGNVYSARNGSDARLL